MHKPWWRSSRAPETRWCLDRKSINPPGLIHTSWPSHPSDVLRGTIHGVLVAKCRSLWIELLLLSTGWVLSMDGGKLRQEPMPKNRLYVIRDWYPSCQENIAFSSKSLPHRGLCNENSTHDSVILPAAALGRLKSFFLISQKDQNYHFMSKKCDWRKSAWIFSFVF